MRGRFVVSLVLCVLSSAVLLDLARGFERPDLGLFLNGSRFLPGQLMNLDLVLINPDQEREVMLGVVLEVGGRQLYWPEWSPDPRGWRVPLGANEIAHLNVLLFELPPELTAVQGSFTAILGAPDGGFPPAEVWDAEVVEFTLVAPTPTPSPTPRPTTPPPTPTPIPCSHEGFVTGYAEVRVSGLPTYPREEKEVIFCLGSTVSGNWVNVRHRSRAGGTYQLKGGLEPYTECGDEVNYWMTEPAANGVWRLWWDGDSGEVRVVSPVGGEESLFIPGGRFAFDTIEQGAGCGGYIHASSPARIDVAIFNGEWGCGMPCDR
jgi:hypothetical protein